MRCETPATLRSPSRRVTSGVPRRGAVIPRTGTTRCSSMARRSWSRGCASHTSQRTPERSWNDRSGMKSVIGIEKVGKGVQNAPEQRGGFYLLPPSSREFGAHHLFLGVVGWSGVMAVIGRLPQALHDAMTCASSAMNSPSLRSGRPHARIGSPTPIALAEVPRDESAHPPRHPTFRP